jgi:hypothetical protein
MIRNSPTTGTSNTPPAMRNSPTPDATHSATQVPRSSPHSRGIYAPAAAQTNRHTVHFAPITDSVDSPSNVGDTHSTTGTGPVPSKGTPPTQHSYVPRPTFSTSMGGPVPAVHWSQGGPHPSPSQQPTGWGIPGSIPSVGNFPTNPSGPTPYNATQGSVSSSGPSFLSHAPSGPSSYGQSGHGHGSGGGGPPGGNGGGELYRNMLICGSTGI